MSGWLSYFNLIRNGRWIDILMNVKKSSIQAWIKVIAIFMRSLNYGKLIWVWKYVQTFKRANTSRRSV